MTNLKIFNGAVYDAPQVVERTGQDWVTYGRNNSYFQYLIDSAKGSVTAGRIINSMINLTYGKGIRAHNARLKANEWAEFRNMISDDDIKKITHDIGKLGQYALEVIYKGGHKKILSAKHIPIQQLAPKKINEEGEITAFYWAYDWTEVNSEAQLTEIAAFGQGEGKEILYMRPYSSDSAYFSDPFYSSAIQWQEIESEIANFHLSNLRNGLNPTMLINFNRGIPKTEEESKEIYDQIEEKLQGTSNSGRWIVAFNESKENESTITAVPLSEAASQYEFLSNESSKKILVGHGVTSPLLLGISSASGFSSNSEELKVSSILYETYTLNPTRGLLIDGLDKLLAFNGMSLDLYFESLNPFQDEEVAIEEGITGESGVEVVSSNQKELDAQAGLRGSVGGVQGILQIQASVADGLTSFESAVSMLIEIYGFSQEVAIKLLGDKTAEAAVKSEVPTNLQEESVDSKVFDILDHFGEEEDLENWELIESVEVNYDTEEELDKQIKLASTGTARPNAKSSQDGKNKEGDVYKVRYQYAPLSTQTNSREFCKKMVTAKKIYRKEDIIMMGNQSVNKGWGLNGADNYSIWLYKGGGNCHHMWFRKTYKLKEGAVGVDINSPNAQTVSTTKARSEGFVAEPNDDKVAVAPVRMPNQGFVNK